MMKKVICLGIIIVMIISVFTACNSKDNQAYGNSLPFSIDYSGEMSPVTETYLKEKVDSLQELIDLSNENDYPFFNENDENYNSDLSQKVREYDDSYFNNKSLILVFFYETSHSPTKIDSVRIKENAINVVIARPNEIYASSDVSTVYAFVIGVNKNDVENMNEVNTKFVYKGKVKDFN